MPGQLLRPDQPIRDLLDHTKLVPDRGARVRVPAATADGCCSLTAPTRGGRRPTPRTHQAQEPDGGQLYKRLASLQC